MTPWIVGIVAQVDPLQEQPPHPGPGKGALGEDGAGQQDG